MVFRVREWSLDKTRGLWMTNYVTKWVFRVFTANGVEVVARHENSVDLIPIKNVPLCQTET